MARSSSERGLSVLLALVATLLSGRASADVRVALYAPWGGPPTPETRRALAQAAARALSARVGEAATGEAFSTHRDFQAAAGAGRIDYAIVDTAVALRAARDRFTLLAWWSSGRPWALLARSSAAPSTLRRGRLALPAADSPGSTWLLSTLLRGQLRAHDFARVVPAPSVTDAVRTTLVDRADVTVGPPSELTAVVDLGAWPELSLVVVVGRRPTGEDAASAIMPAVVATQGGRWAAGRPVLPRVQPNLPVLARPAPVTTLEDLAGSLPAVLPPLSAARFWVGELSP